MTLGSFVRLGLVVAAVATAITRPSPAADLAPGNPPLTQELADLRRDAVEVVFDVQFTARQLREHQRLYAWCWKFAAADWQKAEAARLPEFKDAFDKDAAHRQALRTKHADAWAKDAKAKAGQGNPYYRWVLDTVAAARKEIAAGPPPLRKDQLDNTLEFIQWGLRMQLTVGQQEEFLKHVPKEWNAESKEARNTIVDEFLPVYRKVVRMTPEQRKLVQELSEKELVAALKTPESSLDKWLADAYATANKVLAAGPPDQLTAGGTLQHADFYDWSLGIRLDDKTRAELQNLIVQDWKTIETTRQPSLNTARMMDDPPKGGAGELRRLRDKASMLTFICSQPNNVVNKAAFEVYTKANPTDRPLPVPADATVIAKGEPPLTEGQAECVRRYFEWLLGIEFTADERKTVRELLIDEWTRQDKDAMAGTLEIAFDYSRLAQLPPRDRDLVVAFDRPRVLQIMRDVGAKDKTNEWVLERYAEKRPSLVKGQPGPTQADVDALAELLHFRVTEVTGGDKATADKVKASTVERAKAGTLPSYEVAGAAQQLAMVKYAWPTLTDADKQELRDQWADALRAVGVSAKLATWQSAPAPAKELAYLDAMKKLQQQQQTTAMISNMMRMQHESNMAIIRNMGSTPYRYEYKYEYRRR
jgi:hypothetical protein